MRIKRWAGAWLCLVLACCLLLPAQTAVAEESAVVNVPVIARGADCTAVIEEPATGFRQEVALTKDVLNNFTFECKGLNTLTYNVYLSNSNTDKVIYDHRHFTITVDLYYNSNDEIDYYIMMSGIFAKLDCIEFINIVKDSETIRSVTPATVYKVDERDTPLDGAVFGLYDGDMLLATYTGSSFTIMPPMGYEEAPEANLTLREINPPDGYLLDGQERPVVIRSSITETEKKTDTSQFIIRRVDTSVTVSGSHEAVIVNKTVPAIVYDPPVEKVVTGNGPVPEETFYFSLRGLDGAPMPEGVHGDTMIVSRKGAGSVEFGDIRYDKESVWHYVVEELAKGADGFVYDKTRYLMTVVITLSGGELHKDITIVAEGEGTKDKIVFNNRYDPQVPYDQYFTFTKVWQGDREDGIDWEMYNADGTRRHKLFNKTVVSENEWKYEAWFRATEDVEGCYIVETPMKDYLVRYENVGEFADKTDRCYNGGRIINYKVPKTDDPEQPGMYTAVVAVSLAGLAAIVFLALRKKKKRT